MVIGGVTNSGRGPAVTARSTCLLAALIGVSMMLYAGVASAADPTKGSVVYNQHCKSCHGRNGVSTLPGGPDFSRGEGLMQSDMALLKSVKSGKGMMPGYQALLTEAEILDVIAYLRTIRR